MRVFPPESHYGRRSFILVDEGQDFREEYWLGVELLLRDERESHLHIFFDQNQRFYTKAASLPVKDEPFVLSFNCRNTASIHRLAYGYFTGDPTDPPTYQRPLEGVPAPASTPARSQP